MGDWIWQCTRCDNYLDGNPRLCPHCGYTVYRPTHGPALEGYPEGNKDA